MLILYSILLIIQNAAGNLLVLLPYILLGVLLSELLAYTSWVKIISRHAIGSPHLSVFASALLGAVSPLCTYGTVPIVIQLFRAGVPLPPLAVFMASSSMMNPQLFFLTLGGINAEMAITRLIAVIFFALLLGFFVHIIPSGWIVNHHFPAHSSSGEKSAAEHPPSKFSWKAYLTGSIKSLEYTGFYLLVGIFAGAAVEVLIPRQLVAEAFRPGSPLSILFASLLGIPLYACGGAVIPFVGSLIKEGMSKGAALAFLTVGQATRIQPLAALAALFRPRFLFLYIVLLLLFSLVVGFLYR